MYSKSSDFIKILVILLIGVFPIRAFAFDLYEDNDTVDVWELTFEENINYPQVPTSIQSIVKKCIKKEYQNLQKKGLKVKLVRNDEVILVSLPIDTFFKNNDVENILQGGEEYLRYFSNYLRIKELYRVVFCVHHDNSLDGESADNFTNERVLTLADWMQENCVNGINVVPYSMGNEYPIVSNSTKEGRKKNRRLDVYIFPGKTMLDIAKDNKL